MTESSPEPKKEAADGGGDAAKTSAKQAKAPKEVSQMKAGDYTVHFLIQKAKDLEIDAESVMNVVVEVEITGGKKETTKVFNDVTNTTVVNFDSHVFVELMGKSAAELEQTKICIRLQEKGYFKNSLIGQVEMDLTFIYNLEKHTKQHQWMALINPDSEDFASIAAYIKLSGSVYGVDDTPIELKMDENDDDENCVMPASIKPKFTQLKMHIIKGEHLPKLDFKLVGDGKMDAFISAKIGGKTIKTKIKDTSKGEKADEAIWMETFLIPIRMPIMSGKLILNVMDYDTVNDEQAGALIFDYKELLQRPQKSFFWANIYGAPGCEGLVADGGDLADSMNKDPTIATKWKGRILIGIEHEFLDEKAPRFGCFPVETQPPKDEDGNEEENWQSIADLAKEYMDDEEYHLMYEFNSCINIPEHLEKYNLQLCIGEHKWTSGGGDKQRAVGYNYNRWNQRSELITFSVPYGEVRDMEDIFLYLCPDKGGLGSLFGANKGGKPDDPISYCKIKAKDFMEPNPQLTWMEMAAEPIEDKVKSPELAGVIGFRLSIVKADSGIDLASQPNWKKPLRRRPDSKKIRCYLFQCKDLPAADEDGASDPMVVVYNTVDEDSNKERMKSQVCETECIEDNCDPMFYQLLELKIDYTRGEPLPPFIFDVYDVDKNIIKSDDRDYMGRCLINIDEVAKKYVCEKATEETNQGDTTRRDPGEIVYEGDRVDLKPEIPKWHSIRYAPGSPECGKLLVSFIITEEFDHDWKTPNAAVKMMGLEDPTAVVDFSEYRVELNVLGLRGLISPGLLPVKKAYIDFLLKSMVPPMAASALQSVQTAPGPAGPDPTINSVISFSVPMPKDYLFAPRMSCRVYDKVFKGMSGQLIGVFTIPTGEIMYNQNKEYNENCESLDKIIQALKDVLEEQAVLDYEPTNKNQDSNLINDKGFRDQQRAQKAQTFKALAADPEEEKKSMVAKVGSKIASKVVPAKPVKPTTALSKRLDQGKKNQLKKRLILHTDEDTDEEGETVINPVAKKDTEKIKYIPPPMLDINSINRDGDIKMNAADLDRLSRTPRSSLSQKEKNAVDGLAIRDVIEAKHDENMLKKVTPKAGQVFKPPAPIKVSQNEIENAIKARSGPNTPASAHSSVKQFNSARTSQQNKDMLKEAHLASERAIQRETEASRQDAEKQMAAKEGGKEIKMIRETFYENDTRLNCMREVDIPDPIIFEPLGWDRTPGESKEKHYRKFFSKELEYETSIMSKPTEFQCFQVKRGQSRGAKKSMFDFGGGKADQATGEQDTTQIMGKFKALITVSKKDEEIEKKMYINNKLVEIRKLLGKIYTKKFKKPFPLQEGFFCENALEGSKVMTAEQRERRYSDDIQMPTKESFAAQVSTRSKTSFKFDDRASTILNQEGRAEFKGMIRAMKLTHLQILRKVVDVQSDEIIKRLLMSEAKTNVRVYIVRAFNLAARDNDSPSDPYVKVILGEEVRDDRDNYQEDEPAPDIYKMYEFQAIFPGCPLLKVQFWDADLIFGDDFIGETEVDLEDRYFSSDFKSFQHKPIEHRKLTHPSTEVSQGTVVMWAEINEQFAASDSAQIWDISKKPDEYFEVRVVVWDTEDLEMMDAEGTTDGFIRCFFNSDDRKDTDTHFRNQDGKCSWNYRLLFPFTYPSKNYKLTVQAYDLDLFKSNDLIGQAVIDLEPLFEDSDLAKRPISLSKDYYEDYLSKELKWKNLTFVTDEPRQFWVDLTTKDEKGKLKVTGRLKLQIDLLPKKEAELNPVGEAQSEPNVNPFLPKPFGRIEFSLNPFKMLNQLIGPAMRRKIYCCCCIIICCALCVMMAPMIFSNMISNFLTPG